MPPDGGHGERPGQVLGVAAGVGEEDERLSFAWSSLLLESVAKCMLPSMKNQKS